MSIESIFLDRLKMSNDSDDACHDTNRHVGYGFPKTCLERVKKNTEWYNMALPTACD
jgi:hypothetical protein